MGEKSEKTHKKSWFKGLKAEFGKIIWPGKVKLAKETSAVIVVSILLGALISIMDVIIKYGIDILVQ